MAMDFGHNERTRADHFKRSIELGLASCPADAPITVNTLRVAFEIFRTQERWADAKAQHDSQCDQIACKQCEELESEVELCEHAVISFYQSLAQILEQMREYGYGSLSADKKIKELTQQRDTAIENYNRLFEQYKLMKLPSPTEQQATPIEYRQEFTHEYNKQDYRDSLDMDKIRYMSELSKHRSIEESKKIKAFDAMNFAIDLGAEVYKEKQKAEKECPCRSNHVHANCSCNMCALGRLQKIQDEADKS